MTRPIGSTAGPPRRRRLWLGLLFGGVVLATMTAFIYFSAYPVIAEYRQLAQFYVSKRAVREFLRWCGAYAPLAFIAIQALQVVLAPIPGEATGMLGGYVFGAGLGLAYSTLGLTLGSVLAFLLARWVGLPLVRRVVSAVVYRKLDFVSRTGGRLVTWVCFLIPGFPKDYLCFLLGVSPMPFGTFLVLSTLGRLPGTWLLSIQGAKVRSAEYLEVFIYLGVAAMACAVAYLCRDRLHQWLHRRHPGPPVDRIG